MLMMLHISFAAKAQQTERYLLRENELWKALKSLIIYDWNSDTESS